ncbi:uncharacterized protein LOC111868667 isoform X3 [Cryptotermes secundus]|uniref:uncharacterized protein LOC111868667 isoform X3 n=1 Tax=Cryptotermes secundus TaxID=105785 RepID=UPI001454E047|nr:uncharacterized protein LOC111868667 isoform X3 [Cryptotermes secundus]
MSTREIVLDGGSPWGFRMHGGADVGQPLRISRVNPGSKAAQKGVREGDVISSINGQSTRNITNSDAHALLRNAGQTLQLGLNEECSGSPKRRIHRSVPQETKLEPVKRSTLSKTSTTARTTLASVNGAADPNFNSQLSVKGDLKDGQNGGVKESSTFSTSESRGQRRRRRQNAPQHELPGDTKEDSDTIADTHSESKTFRSVTSSEGGGSRSRRRRRTRGNRRKCLAGNAFGVEGDVSGTELMVAEQDKEIPETEPKTDATMSDIGAKAEKHGAHEREISEVDTVGEVVNREIKREVIFRKVQITNSNVLSFDVNKERLGEVTVENKFPVDFSSSGINQMGVKEGDNVNIKAYTARERRIMVATGNKRIPEALVSDCDKEDVLYQEKVPEVGVNSNDETEIGFEKSSFEDSASEPNKSVQKNTQSLSERCDDVTGSVVQEVVEIDKLRETECIQEIVPEKESHRDVRHNAEEQENIIVLHQKEAAEADIRTIHLEEKGKEINKEKNECEKEASPSYEEVCEAVIVQNDVSLIDVKGRTEFLINEVNKEGLESDETTKTLISEVMPAEIKEQRVESMNSLVRKSVDISRYETDSETHISKTDSEIETENFRGILIVYNSPHSGNDGSSLQITQHAQKVTQEQVKDFGSAVRNTKTRCSPADTGSLIAGEPTSSDTKEIKDITSRSYSCGNFSDLSVTTTNVSHGSGEQVCNTGNCEHRTFEYPLEQVSEGANTMAEDEQCMLVAELHSRKAFGCENGRDIAGPTASDSFKATENKSQLKLCNDACKDTGGVYPGTSSSATADERMVRISEISGEGDKYRTELEENKVYSVSEQSPPECRAVVVEEVGEGMWEEVEELCGDETICEDDRLSDDAIPNGDGRRFRMTGTPSSAQDAKLSQEEKELLDPHPLIDAEDEETLRQFLHSLNLADYSKEAIRSRNAMLRDGNTIEEVYATRKSKRRAPLETYPSQQRGLDVIFEENSSDYSDGEKRVEEAGSLKEKREKAWEEAIFIPETNQIVFLSNDYDEGEYKDLENKGTEKYRIRNRSECYLERKVLNHATESEESTAGVYRRVEKESRSVRTRIVSEETGIDVFSKDMEIALENVRETEEYDSEDGREERYCDEKLEVRIELAESSDDEDDIKRTWKKGRARERQDTVEIVYLEEDSGSTSSGSCIAGKKPEDEAAEDADVEEDPNVLYEEIEFPVVHMDRITGVIGDVQEESLETNSVNAIYENIEFRRNTETSFTSKQETNKGNSDIAPNLQGSPHYSDTNEFATDIYEEVEFVRNEISNTTNTEMNLSTSVVRNEVNSVHLSDNSNTDSGINSRSTDNNNNNNTYVPRESDNENKVAGHFKITEADDSGNIEREQIAIVDTKNEANSLLQSVRKVELTSQLENGTQTDSVTNSTNTCAKESPQESTGTAHTVLESDAQSIGEYGEKTCSAKTTDYNDLQINNSKTLDIVKRILSLIPQGDNMDSTHLESIISQVTSENGQTESLKDSVTEGLVEKLITEDGGHQQGTNEKLFETKPNIVSGAKIFCESIPSDGIEHDANPKTIKSELDSKSPPITTEHNASCEGDIYVEATGKYGECPLNANDEFLQTLCQIDSCIKIVNESSHSRQSGNNLDTKTVQCNPDLQVPSTTQEPNISHGIEIHVEQERPVNISGECGSARDEEDGYDELDSITPTNLSRRESSSSDAGSHGTAVYCPGRFSPQSSDADVSSYAEDTIAESKPLRKIYSPQNIRDRLSKSRSHENISKPKKYLSPTFMKGTESHSKVPSSPKTLKDLTIDKVVSLRHGADMLNALGISVPLRNPEKTHGGTKVGVNNLVQDAVKSSQFFNSPSVLDEHKCIGKSSLSGSLPDISFMKQEALIRDQTPGIAIVKSPPPPVLSPPSIPDSHWLGMPTKEDPNLLVCLSPSQRRSYQEGETPTPEEAGNLLDLHRKFIQRRGYHENPHPPASRRALGARHFFSETPFPNNYIGGEHLNGHIDCQKPSSLAGKCVESEETSVAPKPLPSPRFRTVFASLDSKIHFKGNTSAVIGGLEDAQMEEKTELGVRVNEDKEEDGGGEKERDGRRGSSRLLAILRASSEPQEIQAKHLSPSSSCSPPPLPPLPHAYQHQLAMLAFLQQNRRPTTFCCTSSYNDFDFLLQHGPPRSPSCSNQSSCDSNLQSPTLKTKADGKTSPCFNFFERTGIKKERVSSWYGQSMSEGNDKERLKVKSLSDWLQLVRCGGSSKDTNGTQSKDSTPQVSACVSTQSSPGPIRRVGKDSSPKPEAEKKKCNDLKDHQKLKQDILERRFSLPEGQLEQACQQDQNLIKPPVLPTSARDDERHEHQLKLLQQRQQRLRNQLYSHRTEPTQEKRPPLPQQQSRQKQADTEVKRQERLSPAREERKQQWTALQETLHVERRFDADNYRISKKGDIAIINSNATTRVLKEEQSTLRGTESKEEKNSRQNRISQRPKSLPPPTESLVTGGEIFRQQMYLEYMNKVAERAERRRHKVIRLSSVPREDTPVSETQEATASTVHQLENEFMGRVRERMDKLGLKYDEESDDGIQNKTECGADNCYVITGGGEAHDVGSGSTSVSQLPKHLQEFLVIAGGAGTDSDVNSDVDGVWSPALKSPSGITEDSNVRNKQEKRDGEVRNNQEKDGEDAPPVVWTPKSAGASPTSERKEFRPINFESPPLPRKTLSATYLPATFKPADDLQPVVNTSSVTQEPTTTTTFSSTFPPWQQQQSRDDSTLSVGSNLQSPTSDKSVASSTITSTLDRRLVQSQSAPASGLSALAAGVSSNIRLPRAQNPTITLLQKAREGQLPRGALYLDHKMNPKEEEKSYISPNEILYSVKKEYESEGEKEQRKKIVQLGPRKFEGIGPMTKDGIPIVLRSEVKDVNQAKWYKRMYDSLHRTAKDGHYPYTSPGGYLSEPEPTLYDSDIGYSAKYATLDRRRIKNKENDFTTSTLPRSRYIPHPASIKYATEVYKNQPGRIEDYEPGHSSISDKETKQWWDEVLDIFDGWLETHSPHHHQHHPNYRSSSFLTADAIYQRQTSAEPRTTPSTPSSKPFMTHALKESGYESDSTLVFKRRDENLQSQLSPAEQKLAYKTIQKGGEVPLHGLRKPAPERPKDISEIEYFPISPHLTRIRVHKQNITPLREIVCYPITTTYTNVPPVFSSYKRTAPSLIQVTPRKTISQPPPPSPPKRLSSHHSSTLRLWSKMKLPSQSHRGSIHPRHELCFRDTNVSFLKDRLSHKFGISSRNVGKGDHPVRLMRATSSSPSRTRTSLTTLCRSKSAPEEILNINRKTEVSSSNVQPRKPQQEAARRLSRSPDLTAPMEIRKILQRQKDRDVRERLNLRSLPQGTVVRSSTMLYSSARNAGLQCHPVDKSLHVTVAISPKGQELLQPRTITSTTPTTPTLTTVTATTSKSPSLSGLQKGNVFSRVAMKSSSPSNYSSSDSKKKSAVSPCPSAASSPWKRTNRSASRECMTTESPTMPRSSRNDTQSIIELTTDEGNRRVRKSASADIRKRTKDKSLVTSVKTPMSMQKTVRKVASYNSDKGMDKEYKDNKKKIKKGKLDSNGESRRAHASKKNGVPKPSSGNKSRVSSERKQNMNEKKGNPVPKTETMKDLTVVPTMRQLATQRDSLLDTIAQQNVSPLDSESFFQHLLLRDIPSPTLSAASTLCRSSSVLQRAREFSEQVTGRTTRTAPYRTESTLGLLNIYLGQKRPVTESKFRSLDRRFSLLSRSPSPSYHHVTCPVRSHFSRFKKDSSRHEVEAGIFYSLSPSRSRTPESDGRESVKVRSSSEPPLLSSPTGAISKSHLPPVDIQRDAPSNMAPSARCQSQPSSPSAARSPACRRIRGTRSQTVKTVESIGGLRRRGIRARSAGDVEDAKQGHRSEWKTSSSLQAHSTSSLNISHITDHNEYQSYVMELLHSTRKSERFRELHKFYSSLERLGQLERTASTGDLRPRLKGEEVIDYDRWKQLRTKEKEEEEMKILYKKLKEDQKKKDLLFESKDAESLRWRGERDRGLRCREKSIENLKQHFSKLSMEETDLEAARRKDIDSKKDLYKPLWRGSSVMNLATCLAAVTSSRRGRPVFRDTGSHSMPRSLSRHSFGRHERGICSRLWSSLSMDQVNALKTQLSEIYSSVSNMKRDRVMKRQEYEISVPPESGALLRPREGDKETLHVRCNSLLTSDQLYSPAVQRREVRRTESMKAESISSLPHWKKNGSTPKSESLIYHSDHTKPLSETEKKRLSMTLSQEVLDRVTKKQKINSVPVVRARETRGAIAAAAAKDLGRTPSPNSSPVLSETISPRTCYSLEMSEEDVSDRRASSARKNDFLLVLTPSNGSQSQHHEVQKVVEEWANAMPSTSKAVTAGSEKKTENGVVARLVSTTSASETESASSDTSTRTVIQRIGSGEDVLHKVEYFERQHLMATSDTANGQAKASGRVCRSASDIRTPRHTILTHSSRAKSAPGAFSIPRITADPSIQFSPKKLCPSQSYADFKELFGEQSRLRYTTMPLKTRKKEEPAFPIKSARSETRKSLDDSNVRRSHQGSISPYRAYCSSSSTESLFQQRSRSVSPDPTKYWRAYLQIVKQGDVRRLCNKFESLEDIYYSSTRDGRKVNNQFMFKRYRSDPELARDFLARRGTDSNRVVVRRQEIGDVRWLRRRYETCCRGRSRRRKARALSPVPRIPFRVGDRFMPHINVISKTASLQRRSVTASPQRQSVMSEDEGFTHYHTGEVRRIRDKFESQLSLMGQMFTSTPDVRELRDIAPYLGCHWVAHRFPDTQPNSRSLSSPELRPSPPVSRPSSRESRPRPASSSPTRSRRHPLSILKPQQSLQQRQTSASAVAASSVIPRRDVFANQAFDPSIHRPLYRYQPANNASGPGQRYSGSNWWCRQSSPRPTVTFKESPHRYVESEVTIHYRSPVRSEAKEALSEEELARRQAEAMRRIYQEERRRKYLQELQDMHSRRHTDNFTPSQKSPIPLNRYDDFLDDVGNKGKPRDRTPEPKLVARALYNFVGQTSRELSFRRGDIIFVRRQIDKNWYEGEHNAMIGLFPFNYVEIIPYDGIRTIPKRPSEGQARAKFNFIAQTHLELSLVKGELLVLTRRVDDNWFEGRIGNRKGIFPVSYVEILSEPGEKPVTTAAASSKPVMLPASHTSLMNGSGIKQSMGQHSYQPSSYYSQNKMTSSYTSSNPYATLPRQSQTLKQSLAPVNQTLHIDTHSDPVPYRALYNYRPQNEDELELCEGDMVYVMEKCDDGWYVGSSQRTGYFGTFPGNYVERI